MLFFYRESMISPIREQHPRSITVSSPTSRRSRTRRIVLNVTIGVLAVLVLALSYSFVERTLLHPSVDPRRAGVGFRGAGAAIQLDVLNGCGSAGAGSEITSYLRARGFDVVDLRNYKTFDVQETLIIDRVADRENAKRVAYALGVAESNIVEQLNPDYYVDVTVVIGKDYHSLKPSQ